MLLRMAFLAAVACFVSACGRSLPPYEKPIARANFQHVRTTAYTHSESDHLVHGCQTCVGTPLRSGAVNSAAADWSRWPAGTVFRLLSTGQNYRVEDYGWALSGRNTIDLYMANQREMNSWGARPETIEVLKWGDPQESLQFLRRHQDYRHIKRMVLELEGRQKEAASLR